MTVSLDSQVVLTIVGIAVAGLVFRQAARQEGFGLSAGIWWDLVFAAVLGGRLVWVVTHAEYYLRQPLQIVVLSDGGLHAVGLALGAAFWVWRFSRTGDAPPWRSTADLVAIGVLTTCLFERVGCALTTCGTGPVSGLPWAIMRSAEGYTPLAVMQVIVLAVALIIAAEALRMRAMAVIATWAALTLTELITLVAGRPSAEGLVAFTTLLTVYALTWWYVPAPDRHGVPSESGPP